MAAKTRFGLEGFGVRRAGSFANKILRLFLKVNPKWLRDSLQRSFAVEALHRPFAVSTPRDHDVQAKARNFERSAELRSYSVEARP